MAVPAATSNRRGTHKPQTKVKQCPVFLENPSARRMAEFIAAVRRAENCTDVGPPLHPLPNNTERISNVLVDRRPSRILSAAKPTTSSALSISMKSCGAHFNLAISGTTLSSQAGRGRDA